MADKISKYSFEQVESKLDIIRNDMGTNKVLLGDGTYGDLNVQIQENIGSVDNDAIDDLFS